MLAISGDKMFTLRIGNKTIQRYFDTPMGALRDELLPIIRSATDISLLSQLASDWNSIVITYQRTWPAFYASAISADVKNEITDQIKKLTPPPVVQEPDEPEEVDTIWNAIPTTPIALPDIERPVYAPVDRSPKSVSPSTSWLSPTVLILGGLGILAGFVLLKKKGR